jgi:hypothetical protein
MSKNKQHYYSAHPNRTYRDSMFRFLFGNEDHKDWTLSLVNPLHLIQRIRWSFQSLWAPDFPAADTAGCTDIYSEELYIPSSPNNSRTL